jgi:predicted nucleic-acid-binding Zn-ribbon protein
MLKCPRCKQQSARKQYGYNRELGKNFTQKTCYNCGYATPRNYGMSETPEAHDLRMEAMHQRITEYLADKTP